jgi:hypothetical protein
MSIRFPKLQTKRKKKKHPQSILQMDGSYCYICALFDGDFTPKQTQEHHIFPGTSLRAVSEENGFKVRLCRMHHEGDENGVRLAVHHPEYNNYSRLLQQACQTKYEQTHTREEWMELVGRNYL